MLKFSFLVTEKSEQDPDVHRFMNAHYFSSCIRIRIRIEVKTESGSVSALKPVRIHNTGLGIYRT
jgi:hypothetical protein